MPVLSRTLRLPNLSLPSQQVVSGVTAAAGVLLVAAAAGFAGGPTVAAAVATGAVCTSIADIPDALEHKPVSFLVAFVLGGLITLVTGLTETLPWLMGLFVVVVSFSGAIITVYGRPALPLSMTLILAMVFALGTPPVDRAAAVQHALLFTLGGGAYAVYGVLAGWFLEARHKQLALAESLHAFADYARLKAQLYDIDIGIEETFTALIERQVLLMERVQAARNLVFRRLNDDGDRQWAAALAAALDAFETFLSSQTDYWLLRGRLGKATVMTAMRDGIVECADLLDQLSQEIRDGQPAPSFGRLQGRFEEIGGLADRLQSETPVDDAEQQQAIAVLQARIETMRHGVDQLALLQKVVREPAAAQARLDGIDLGAFLPPRPWRLRFLLRQLRWRSPIFRYALRLSAAMLAAFILLRLLEPYLPHSSWIMLTVAVIMRASYSATRQRQKDRLIGNLLGCVLAAFALHVLPDLALVALTFIAIGFSHAYAPVRYRVTSTSACIMALMIMHFSNPGTDSLLLVRLVDTALGAAIAVAFSFMLPVWERQGLPGRIASLLQADRDYARQALKRNPADQTYRLSRKQVFDAISDLAGALRRLPDEPGAAQYDQGLLQRFLTANYRLASYLASLQVLLRMHGAEYAPEDLEGLLSEYREKLQAMLAQPAADETAPAVEHNHGNDSTLPERLASTLAVAAEIRGLAGALRVS